MAPGIEVPKLIRYRIQTEPSKGRLAHLVCRMSRMVFRSRLSAPAMAAREHVGRTTYGTDRTESCVIRAWTGCPPELQISALARAASSGDFVRRADRKIARR